MRIVTRCLLAHVQNTLTKLDRHSFLVSSVSLCSPFVTSMWQVRVAIGALHHVAECKFKFLVSGYTAFESLHFVEVYICTKYSKNTFFIYISVTFNIIERTGTSKFYFDRQVGTWFERSGFLDKSLNYCLGLEQRPIKAVKDDPYNIRT